MLVDASLTIRVLVLLLSLCNVLSHYIRAHSPLAKFFYTHSLYPPISPHKKNTKNSKSIQIMESLSSSTNELEMDDDFRLWLSTKPDDRIPVPILQASHKVAIEEPAGLKAQLLKVGRYLVPNPSSLAQGRHQRGWTARMQISHL